MGGVEEKVAGVFGFVSRERYLTEMRLVEAAAKRREAIDMMTSLLYGGKDKASALSFMTDETVNEAWKHREDKDNGGWLAWRIVVSLLRNIVAVGGEVVGFDPNSGPQVVDFDPAEHIYFNRSPSLIASEQLDGFRGRRAIVVIPGVRFDGEVLYRPRVEFLDR